MTFEELMAAQGMAALPERKPPVFSFQKVSNGWLILVKDNTGLADTYVVMDTAQLFRLLPKLVADYSKLVPEEGNDGREIA